MNHNEVLHTQTPNLKMHVLPPLWCNLSCIKYFLVSFPLCSHGCLETNETTGQVAGHFQRKSNQEMAWPVVSTPPPFLLLPGSSAVLFAQHIKQVKSHQLSPSTSSEKNDRISTWNMVPLCHQVWLKPDSHPVLPSQA